MTPKVKAINKIIRHNTVLSKRIKRYSDRDKAEIHRINLLLGQQAFKKAIGNDSVNFEKQG